MNDVTSEQFVLP